MTRPTNPPGAALWLLERLGPHDESVAGDIAERFAAHGHSAAWAWRQVLVTIVVAAFRDIREHKLLAITSLVVGFALVQAFAAFLGGPVVNGVSRQGGYVDAALLMWLLWSAGFAATGAVVARMSRPVPGAMVLLFASVVMLASVPGHYGLLQDALERPVFWSRLLLLISRDVTLTLCIVAGGVWANTTASVARLGKSPAAD
jgi:hypothetical protein